jgi:AcrR family transcriptional regulator
VSQAVKRGVGRPRASNKTPRLPAREDILVASAELFAEFGFKGTSTKKIAEKVGIRQPSLFHHFRKKQDILTALVEDGGTPVLNYLKEIDFAADPAVELYKLLVFDYHYSANPYALVKF